MGLSKREIGTALLFFLWANPPHLFSPSRISLARSCLLTSILFIISPSAPNPPP